jgi:uncharacterized RDD family membrane protein YckC
MNYNENEYPGVTERLKAAGIDIILMVANMFLVFFVFESLGQNIPDNIRMIAFIFIVYLYDPVFTSFFGGTLGHLICGICVKRYKYQDSNVFILVALFRFIVKSLFGILSLVSFMNNPKGRALHDIAAGTIVIYRKNLKQIK